jgi:hypothetical protein
MADPNIVNDFPFVYSQDLPVDSTLRPLFLDPENKNPVVADFLNRRRLDLKGWGAITIILSMQFNSEDEIQLIPRLAKVKSDPNLANADRIAEEFPSPLSEFKSALAADKGVRESHPTKINISKASSDDPTGATVVKVAATFGLAGVNFSQLYVKGLNTNTAVIKQVDVIAGHGA